MVSVYAVTNLVNGKKYIGQTSQQLNARWTQHKQKTSECTVLRNSIQKYGSENFTVEVLNVCRSRDAANQVETFWIKELNTIRPHGFNRTAGGSGSLKMEVSLETRQKMSAAGRGKKKKPAHVAKVASALKGHKVSEETRAKIGAANSVPLSERKASIIWIKDRLVWAVRIHIWGKPRHFGHFSSREEAASVLSYIKTLSEQEAVNCTVAKAKETLNNA